MKLDNVELLPYMLNRVSAALNTLWLSRVREYGLTTQRWQVLSVLSAFDGCRLGAMADMCGSEQSVMSRVVNQMERDKLVERRVARDDNRASEIWLSAYGRETFMHLLPDAQAMIEGLLVDINVTEQQQLMGLLSRLLTASDTLKQDGLE